VVVLVFDVHADAKTASPVTAIATETPRKLPMPNSIPR
jgi:hypothetical protein